MTTTPRTDQHEKDWIRYWASEDISREPQPLHTLDFARELECELERMRDLLEKIASPFCRMTRGEICQEINKILK